jgi:hypothetical protein
MIPQSAVDSALTRRLYVLFARYYERVTWESFVRDQSDKDWVLLLSDDRGCVRGFTSLKRHDLTLLGRRVRTVFSGNTIIDPDFWGEQEMARGWYQGMERLRREEPGTPLYWFLISSGYRTYLYLPLFFRRFHPCCLAGTPPFERLLMEKLGRMKFPDEYRDGIVRVRHPREILRPEIAAPPLHKLKNPHVRYFLEKNPGYVRGDELACLAEFTPENIRRFSSSPPPLAEAV